MVTRRDDIIDLMNSEFKFRKLAGKIALSLADEIANSQNPSEASLEALQEAMKELSEIGPEIDNLILKFLKEHK